jgi:hypothetical protein
MVSVCHNSLHSKLPTGSWQSQAEGVASWNVFGPSKHRIYPALDNPNGPWRCSPKLNETQLPWIDVLEKSCNWAAGSKTTDDVLHAITTHVNGSLGLKYDTGHGHSVYTSASGIDPMTFVDLPRSSTRPTPRADVRIQPSS